MPGLPGLGAAIGLARDPYGFWLSQYRAHGPVFRLTLPIEGRHWLAIAGREANALMAREGHRLFSQKMTYPKAPRVLGTELHPSITEGALQRHLRRQVAAGFSRQGLVPHLPAMTTWVREHIDRWSAGQRFNVTRETSRLGLNCVSLFATGQELGADSEGLRRYATVFTGVIATGWPMAMMDWGPVRRVREGLDAMIERRLDEHRRVPPGPDREPDYFDSILQGRLPAGEPLPPRVQVVFGQIPFKNMGVYAGRVINHVLYQLVTRPDVLKRVQPEIDRVLSDDEITLEELGSMQALRATILETLRVLPIAVALQRTVSEPFDFAGYRFEVGDRVFTPLSVTHFLPEFFPEPARFDIDRYYPARSEHRQVHVYTPFGLGHHACVARGVFEAITMVVVGTVLHRYRLEAPYALRTIVDALPGPWPGHRMRVAERRAAAPPPGTRRRSPTLQLSLPAALLDAIDGAPVVELPDGATLFSEGDAADRLYFVLDGRVRVSRRRRGTEEPVTLMEAERGDVVGEIGVLQGVPRTATVTAIGSARLVAVDAETFRDAVLGQDVTARELADLALRRHAGAVLASILTQGGPRAAPRDGRIEEIMAQAGEVVIQQGAPPDRFYLLSAGAVQVTIDRADAEPLVLAELRAPDCFGEIGLLEARPRTATVRVSSEDGAHLLALDRRAFQALFRDERLRSELSWIASERASEAPPAK